jgi:hypothetical protein
VITYEDAGAVIRVKLDGKIVGSIVFYNGFHLCPRGSRNGYQYFPKGCDEGGEIFKTLSACKMSLGDDS